MSGTGIRIIDMPDLGSVTAGSSLVGDRAGSGRFGALAMRDYCALMATPHAVGDNVADDTAAIQATVNAVAAAGGGVVFLPKGHYRITSAITVPTNGKVWFRGEGLAATVIRQTSTTADGIVFLCDNYATAGGGCIDMTIEAGAGFETAAFQGTGSSGTGLKVSHCNDNFTTLGLGINNFNIGLALYGCWNTRHNNLRIMFMHSYGVTIGPYTTIVGGGNSIIGGKISNFGFTGDNTSSIGIYITSTGGEYFSMIDITAFYNGIMLQPPTGANVAYLFFSNVLCDTSVGNGWYIDGSAGGYIYSIHCSLCWASFNGANGMEVVGPNVKDLQWTAGRLRENVGSGLWLETGGIQVVGGSIVHNSRTNDNVQPGVRVRAGVGGFGFIGVRIGNDGESAAVQAEGILIESGASDYFRIIACDLSLPGAGKVPLANGGASTSAIISNNLPTAALGLNAYNAEVFSGCSLGVVAATTTYLGPNGYYVSETFNIWRAPRHGVISLVSVFSTTAPGAGQTYTFMLRVNSADTAVTGTISGASATSWTASSPGVTVNTGDYLCIRVVTSATAASSPFSYNVRLE